jgi:hypothetical protein
MLEARAGSKEAGLLGKVAEEEGEHPLMYLDGQLIPKMIEEMGAIWEHTQDRTKVPVTIWFAPNNIWAVSLEQGAQHPYWTIRETALTPEQDASRLQEVEANWTSGIALGRVVVGDRVCAGLVLNGRRPGWTITTPEGVEEFR